MKLSKLYLDTTKETHRNLWSEPDTKENFKKILPHVRFSSKFLWIGVFHRNFVGFLNVESFVPKGCMQKKTYGNQFL
jgi:hypothetical protein